MKLTRSKITQKLCLATVFAIASMSSMAESQFNNCPTQGPQDMFIKKISCHDDGCSVIMYLEEDIMALKMDASNRIKARCGQECEPLDGKKSTLAKVTLKSEYWDPAATTVCKVKDIDLLMP